MSAAIPMSTSLTLNFVSSEQMRMSHALLMSIARPYDIPCRMQMTGLRDVERVEMQDWKERMWDRRAWEVRAGSDAVVLRAPPVEAACTSRPAVKARGPVEVRRMLRTAGEEERRVIIVERFCHILGVGVSIWVVDWRI